jgi:broad specificity phosphatase PhoE
MTAVLLVRHGVTDWNDTMRAQGQADIPLNARGRSEAREVAAALSGLDVVAVYSSDLERARDTAEAIAAAHGVEVTIDPAFREIDQGEWTGLTDVEIAARWPDRWGPARNYRARPGGESPDEVRRRALAGLRRAVEAHPRGTVVVVSHGVAIRTLVGECLGLRGRDAARIRGLANGGVVSLVAEVADGRLVLSDLERWDGRAPARDDPNQ